MKNVIWILAAALLSSPATAADALGMEIGAPLVNLWAATGSGVFNNVAIDSTAKQNAFLFQCGEAVTINGLGFRYGVRTGTPPTYRISLQGVNTSGNPDGTIKGGGSPVSTTFTPPASTAWDGTTQLQTPASNYTCTRGEFLAEVIDYSSGTVDGSNNSSFTVNWTAPSNTLQTFPAGLTHNGSSWSKSTNAPIYFYTSTAGKTYGLPISTVVSTTRSSGAESAMFFSLPASTVASYQVAGIRLVMAAPAAAKAVKVVLYSGTTVLQSITLDSDYFSQNGGTPLVGSILFTESVLSTLTSGTTYRIGVSPQDSSNNVALRGMVLHNAQALTAFPGGSGWGYSTRTGCSGPCDAQTTVGWTDDSTVRPLMSLILADITASASSAGTTSYIFVK